MLGYMIVVAVALISMMLGFRWSRARHSRQRPACQQHQWAMDCEKNPRCMQCGQIGAWEE